MRAQLSFWEERNPNRTTSVWETLTTEQQAEVVADSAMTGDHAVGDGEDVNLFVGDRPAGWRDVVERTSVLSRHDGGGHHRAALGDAFLQLEAQVRERIA